MKGNETQIGLKMSDRFPATAEASALFRCIRSTDGREPNGKEALLTGKLTE